MTVAKVSKSGNSQAVRLPKAFRFEDDEVIIKRVGDAVLLFPRRYDHAALKNMLDQLDPDFALERGQPSGDQKREFDG